MVALFATGCGFEIASTAIDAPGAGDSPDAPGTTACPWAYDPVGFNPCTGEPTEVLPDLDLQGGMYVYDTSSGSLNPPIGTVLQFTERDNVHVLWTRSFRIGAGSTLRVIGELPLVLVSQSGVTIDGTIDVGSHRLDPNNAGAGSDPDACDSTAAQNGLPCDHGGSGGGGGGFGTAGANGGAGAMGGAGQPRNCTVPMNAGIPGGAGGRVATDLSFRGGCDGGHGAMGNNPTAGSAGAGGGAIHIIARGDLVVGVTGKVLAGGAGGSGGNNGRSGGGGGGSGGLIWLSATTIRIGMNAVLAANGGGGGGGSDNAAAGGGEDGQASLVVAVGGTADPNGSVGGAGATSQAAPVIGGAYDRGGGGGGGGTGGIRLMVPVGKAPPLTTGAIITPAPI